MLVVAIIVPLLSILNRDLANSILSILATGVLSGRFPTMAFPRDFPEPVSQEIEAVSAEPPGPAPRLGK